MEVKQILQILWRWRWPMIAVVIIILLGLGLATLLAEPAYRARAKLHITTPEQENVSLFDERRTTNDRDAIIVARNNFQVVVESSEVRSRVIERLELQGADQEYELEVLPIRDADFIDIAVTAMDPERAAEIANTHAEIAIESMGELSSLRSREAKNYFANQLEVARKEMSLAESELTAFQTDNNIVDLASALEDNHVLLQQLKLERNRIVFDNVESPAELVAPIETLIDQRHDELDALLAKRSTHNTLVENVALAEETYQTVLAGFNWVDPDNPPAELVAAATAVQEAQDELKAFLRLNDMVVLESEIGMLQNQIARLQLDRDQRLLTSDQETRQATLLESVEALIAEREAEIDRLTALEPQYNLLQMTVQQTRTRYELVAGKYSEANLKTDALQSADFLQIVSPALPPQNSTANNKRLIIFGLVGSVGVAILLAFLLEYLRSVQPNLGGGGSTSRSRPQELEGTPAA